MDTSEEYNFLTNEKIVDFITDAYEKCGFTISELSGYQLKTARRSLNYLTSSWVNKGVLLWAIDQQMLTLIPGQNTYSLPQGTINVVPTQLASAITVTRNTTTTGVASSSSGVAANAFDGNLTTACIQSSPNGYIQYDMGTDNQLSIPFIGILSNINTNYTLSVQYSLDGVNWTQYNQPETITYSKDSIFWIVPYQAPLGRYFRIVETGGATLNITELYFSYGQQQRIISRLSMSDWIALPNKTTEGEVTSFCVQPQITPVIQFWPTPSSNITYNNVIYYRTRQIQDAGDYINNADAPQRYYMALSDCLAAELALKFKPDTYAVLKDRADRSFKEALDADVEHADLTFSYDPYY